MDDWEAIPLSRLAHAGYCMRRAALLTNEQLWAESSDTAKGRLEHERVHTERLERRGDSIKLFEHTVFSKQMNLSGKCDCIEGQADDAGCTIADVPFPVRLYPIEYKHGSVREEEEYNLQLCAQAMCLEEMYHTQIPEGAIFYITAHRRLSVIFDEALREKVRQTVAAIDAMRRSFDIPPAVVSAKCKRCSLNQLCMPDWSRSAAAYCKKMAKEAMEVDCL